MAIDTRDFNDFAVEEKLHVAISVKDFKAIILHADSLKTKITARYTRPCRPLQLSYAGEGMDCEFTLMTRGDDDEPDAETRASRENTIRELSARASPRPQPQTQTATQNQTADNEEPRRVQPSRSQSALPDTIMQEARADTPEPPPAPAEDDDLFVPADDDQQWDEAQYGDADEEDDVLRWDANIDQVTPSRTFGSCKRTRCFDNCVGIDASKAWGHYSGCRRSRGQQEGGKRAGRSNSNSSDTTNISGWF